MFFFQPSGMEILMIIFQKILRCFFKIIQGNFITNNQNSMKNLKEIIVKHFSSNVHNSYYAFGKPFKLQCWQIPGIW